MSLGINGYLNKHIFMYIFVVSQICSIGANSSNNDVHFNYYRRNNDGTFILGNIDTAGINIDLFS
jgi:hypothetical protein